MRLIDGDALVSDLCSGMAGTFAESDDRVEAIGVVMLRPTVDAASVLQWTPVENGLPDEPGWYLVSSRDGDASFEAFYGRSGGWFDDKKRDITWAITAWAKKPAPYKPRMDADAPERSGCEGG